MSRARKMLQGRPMGMQPVVLNRIVISEYAVGSKTKVTAQAPGVGAKDLYRLLIGTLEALDQKEAAKRRTGPVYLPAGIDVPPDIVAMLPAANEMGKQCRTRRDRD